MRHRRLLLAAMAVVTATLLGVAIRSGAVGQSRERTDTTAGESQADATAGDHQNSPPQYKSVLIRDVPHVRQKSDFCGEACAAMYLRKLGQPIDQDYVFDQSGLDPMQARGCYTKELAAALSSIGFDVGPVWHKVPAAEQAKHPESLWKALHADLLAGVPSIVCMYYAERSSTEQSSPEHFRLILGYDADTDEVIYHEPAEADGAYRRMERVTLLKLWPLKYDARQWTVIRLRLQPKRIKPGKPATTFTAADYAQHLMQLNKKVPSDSFTIILQPPFVVIGDESPAILKRRAVGTIKWTVDKLNEAYFTKDPAKILDIWLFKDNASYRKHTKEIFGSEPSTPYGYFSHADGALVMNIATGGGTLVHEIVHPFVAANFPECPAWFNEGLGSLYEQSAERDGQIVGLTNWRLSGWDGRGGLQQAIRDGRVPSFETLCSTTDHQFYREDPGTNYAQARYLCYYLQEHGLLRKFYHSFHANRKEDPTGYETLKNVLGRDDMAAFKKDWEAFVLKLQFR
ncbi:MAG: hypothetical protein A2V70_17880 [Planctomycetes bacterium RBG_13_63_9]|nr:MAG: hypothetical protein A2V70_17880 [Planctomycetes bacterium RBG_13_63_9]